MKISFKYKIILRLKKFFNNIFTLVVTTKDKKFTTKYLCSNKTEIYRACTLWEKEPGTMLWIDENVKDGDVFLDIGANMGIYALAAAHRVGQTGKVYAAEPHKATVISLMNNIKLNNYIDTIEVFTNPLTDNLSVAEFNYKDFNGSVTGSQFGTKKINSNQAEFNPVNREISVGISTDMLLQLSNMRPPSLIKIDVDGIELNILKGMSKLLTSSERPRSIQVELNVGEQDKIIAFMSSCDYKLEKRHLTHDGNIKASKGINISDIAHNAIFIPK